MTNYNTSDRNFIYTLIVSAIQKAITEDFPNYTMGIDLETTNHRMLLRGDLINTNLRNLLPGDDIFLMKFNRFNWRARLVVDKIYKRVFCITTDSTIRRLGSKSHPYPHYSQTFVNILNKDLKGKDYQGELFYEEFSSKTYNSDMQLLKESGVDLEDGYHFYYISYTVEEGMVGNVRMLLLDSQFTVVEEKSLIEYLKPDYSTVPDVITKEQLEQLHNERTQPLVSLKPGAKPIMLDISKEA